MVYKYLIMINKHEVVHAAICELYIWSVVAYESV